MHRLVFADNCDDEPSQAGDTISSAFGQSQRGALVRIQMALRDKPRDPKLLAEQRRIVEHIAPMLCDELEAIPGWRRMNRGRPQPTPEDLIALMEGGMISYTVLGGETNRQEDITNGLAQHMPVTKVRLEAVDKHMEWLSAKGVKKLPETLVSVDMQDALLNRQAQDAFFAHPLMKNVRELRLTPPKSVHGELITASHSGDVFRHGNIDYDPNAGTWDLSVSRRFTNGALGNQLQQLTVDYPVLTNDGVRNLIGSPKLANTVIEFSPAEARGQRLDERDWARSVNSQTWRELAKHNENAAKAQGGEYALSDSLRNAINQTRSTLQWITRSGRVDNATYSGVS
ncbi:MAG: hypothetical protein K2Q01_12195 [Rickettsiales bacterium]|nr:hypothetical protein [Rickettsiales bacterium]